MKTKKEIKIGDMTFEFNSPNILDKSTLDMMNDWCRLVEQQQIIDEAYVKYMKCAEEYSKTHLYEPYTQEQFINKCKTDTEFSEKWGLKIEERELNQRERCKLLSEAWKQNGIPPEHEEVSTLWVEYNNLMKKYDIPTRLITITYNNQTIESYE